MGSLTATAGDAATDPKSGAFVATGAGAIFYPTVRELGVEGFFNVWLWGTFVATVTAERSFDGGTTWVRFAAIDGVAVGWTAPMTTQLVECEPDNLWRLNCTSFTSGAVNWRLSQ